MADEVPSTDRRRKPRVGRMQRQNVYFGLVEEHWRNMVAAVLDEDYGRYCAERLRWRAAEATLFELVHGEWAGPEPLVTRNLEELIVESEALYRRRTWRVLRGKPGPARLQPPISAAPQGS